MEQETHTRLIFPGTFVVGTFFWLAFVWNAPIFRIFIESNNSNLVAILIALVITVPSLGFFTDTLRHRARNYDWDIFNRFPDKYVRNTIKSQITKLVKMGSLGKCPSIEDLSNIDPDVFYSLIARGGWNADIHMPKDITDNARRRWTVVWASWNAEFAIILGILFFISYFALFIWVHGIAAWAPPPNHHRLWANLLLTLCPVAIGIWFESSGKWSRKRVIDLEKLWAIRAGIFDGELEKPFLSAAHEKSAH